MKLKGINVQKAIEGIEIQLEREKDISPELKAAIKILIIIVNILINKLGINSKNSSKPPSEDKNRERGSNREKSNKKPGGQKGHIGKRLSKVKNPDIIEEIKIDRRKLPKGKYKEIGYEARQVFEIRISREITEYRAQIIEDEKKKRYVAKFPEFVKKEVQYGLGVKCNTVYMSQFQLVPYNRIQDQCIDQMKLPISTGTIFNFNKEAYNKLEYFEKLVKEKILKSELIHVDETGINVNKKLVWLHSTSNKKWTYFYPHKKRGSEAMDEIGILPKFEGIICHDHWKPYYKYNNCTHALCNAHHKRELTKAEEAKQKWARIMKKLLLKINKAVEKGGGVLEKEKIDYYKKRYRKILKLAEKIECPIPKRKKGQRGRLKKSKSRNLLERLQNYEEDVLRFMKNKIVPFTNNLGENDLRMTKVQQKISGCFRSMNGAYMFCRIRSYLSTCRKNNVSSTDALRLLFQGKLPAFLKT